MMNPPKNEFLFSWAMGGGGGAGTERKVEWDGLVKLADVVKAKLWGFEEGKNKTIREMVGEIAKRNAEMVAGWQAWGFMHGQLALEPIIVALSMARESWKTSFESARHVTHEDFFCVV